ncbi:adhesion G-protein coupled receptor F3 [Sorex fumeus]|uniref:adhesion G-protein coupled receptor F3 n=1 Tax=Sorex fumeus TaxID=62283 RepID=UPI0024AD397D|nr:adhesion G-protein coupled receptor F3 [Sorex fumeus]
MAPRTPSAPLRQQLSATRRRKRSPRFSPPIEGGWLARSRGPPPSAVTAQSTRIGQQSVPPPSAPRRFIRQRQNCPHTTCPPRRPSAPADVVLASVYVQLDFARETWLAALSRGLTLPAAAGVASSPRALTGLRLTTECHTNGEGITSCACLSGHQWNASACSRHPQCQQHYHQRRPCACLILGPSEAAEAGYCQQLPPVPGNLSLDPSLPLPGSTLHLTLLTAHQPSGLEWLLWRSGQSSPIYLHAGTRVSLTSSRDQVVLSITNITHHWAGEYMCTFEAQGFQWVLHQRVKVALQAADVTQLPDQVSVFCADSSGFQLRCCIPSTQRTYTASWSPQEGSTVSSFVMPDSWCLELATTYCPAADTTYTCVLRSPEHTLRIPVSVTVIQDGDITCPAHATTVAWNITKAGHVAQAPCPMHRTGLLKRVCGPDGTWGPVHGSCIDSELMNLLRRAWLLRAGQGRPAMDVPQLLVQLEEQVGAVSSPSDLLALLSTMKSLAKVVQDDRLELDREALQAALRTADQVLDMDTSDLWAPAQAQKPSAASDFLLALETLARSLCPQDHPLPINLPNVQLQTQLWESTFPSDYRMTFATQPPLQARIPGHSLAPLSHNGTNVSITSLVLHKLDHLLPSNYGPGLGNSHSTTPGLVLAISIMAGGQVCTQGEVLMDFGGTESPAHCVFWDYSLFRGKGGWSDEGCQVQAAGVHPANAQCICGHLTAFSILMSRHGAPESASLELLSRVGLAASIVALLLCLAVYRLVWRVVVRNKVAYLRHTALVNVALCLLAADSCFLGTSLLPPQPRSPLCLAAAFLCHFLYLATFFWMLAQALMMAHQLLFVFRQLSRHRTLSLMVVLGYLCPMGLAGVALGLYLPRGRYLREGACWLDAEGGALYTFVGPVLAIVGVNGLVLTMAVLKLLRPSLSEGPQAERRQALLGVLKALLILTPIFGLTWGLGLATLLEEVSAVPHYVFTILNTSQGVFILLFGCLMDKKVQEALLKRFCRSLVPSSTISLATSETCTPSAAGEEVNRTAAFAVKTTNEFYKFKRIRSKIDSTYF